MNILIDYYFRFMNFFPFILNYINKHIISFKFYIYENDERNNSGMIINNYVKSKLCNNKYCELIIATKMMQRKIRLNKPNKINNKSYLSYVFGY